MRAVLGQQARERHRKPTPTLARPRQCPSPGCRLTGGLSLVPSLRVMRKDSLLMEDGRTGQEKQTCRPVGRDWAIRVWLQ